MRFSCFVTVCALLLIMPSGLQADTPTQVVSVQTDAYAGTEFLDLIRGPTGLLTGAQFRGASGAPVVVTLAQLRSGPQLLKTVNGHGVTFLSLEPDFAPIRGGHANLRFLVSGLSNSYRNFRILVDIQGTQIVLRSDPNPRDPESDQNPYTSVFNHVFMQKNTLFGQLVGIARVVPSQLSR